MEELKINGKYQHFKGKFYITANCPVVVSYIKKYAPELINNLAPIVSPH